MVSRDGPDQQWERVQSLFGQALEHPAEERQAWVDGLTAEDSAVRAELASLLTRMDETRVARGDSGPQVAARDSRPDDLPERIGDYTVLGLVGRGGMGWVLEARQRNPDRRVALKMVRGVFADGDLRRRFAREAQVLGRLSHPAIAQVFEAGTATLDSGQTVPYIAMELVEGALPIDSWCERRGLPLRERLELFCEVVDGIEHGHQRGVLHRDLKPGNVLVDGQGRPRIIDFGLARVLGEEGASSLHTLTGQILGTPRAMSPEQFRGDPQAVDERSDVYALGALLYELVAGRPALDLDGLTLVEMAEAVQTLRPARLSGGSTTGSQQAGLLRDLDTIVAMALEKEPERRYASAAALAADLRRLLRGEPLAARPASALYQLRLFTRRHRTLVASTALVLVVSLAATAISLRFAWLADERADGLALRSYAQSLAAAARALERDEPLEADLRLAELADGLGGWERRHLESHRQRVLWSGRAHDHTTTMRRGIDDRVEDLLASGDGRRVVTASRSQRLRVWDVATGDLLREFDQAVSGQGRRASLAFDAAGEQVLASLQPKNQACTLLHGRVADGQARVLLEGPAVLERARNVALAPAGDRMALLGAAGLALHDGLAPDAPPRAWLPAQPPADAGPADAGPADAEPADAEPADAEPADAGAVDALAVCPTSPLVWTPDGRSLLVQLALPDGDLAELDADDLSLQRRWPLDGQTLDVLALSGDGTTLAMSLAHGGLLLLDRTQADARPRQPPLTGADSLSGPIALDHGGRHLLIETGSQGLELFDLDRPDSVRRLAPFGPGPTRNLLLGDGEVVVAGGPEGGLACLATHDLRDLSTLQGHALFAYAVAPTDTGGLLVSGGWDGWPDSPHGARDGSLRWWDAESGEPVAARRDAGRWVQQLAPIPGSDLLVLREARTHRHDGDRSTAVVVLDGRTGRMLARRPVVNPSRMSVHPGGEWLVVSSFRVADQDDGGTQATIEADLLDARTLERRRRLPPMIQHAFHPTRQLLAGRVGATLTLHNLDGGAPLWQRSYDIPPGLRDMDPAQLVFSPDGRHLGLGLPDGRVLLIDAADGEPLRTLDGFAGKVHTLLFSSDGERLFCGDAGGTLHVLETRTWQRLVDLRGHGDYLYHLAEDPARDRILSASGDGTVRAWDSRGPVAWQQAREQHRALVRQLEPRVLDLLDGQGLAILQAHARLEAAADLTPREREVALQLLLRESVARDPDPLGEQLEPVRDPD